MSCGVTGTMQTGSAQIENVEAGRMSTEGTQIASSADTNTHALRSTTCEHSFKSTKRLSRKNSASTCSVDVCGRGKLIRIQLSSSVCSLPGPDQALTKFSIKYHRSDKPQPQLLTIENFATFPPGFVYVTGEADGTVEYLMTS